MKVKTISVLRSRTVNLGNFESTKVEFGATADIEDDENEAAALKKLDLIVKDRMKLVVGRIIAKRDAEEAGEASPDTEG